LTIVKLRIRLKWIQASSFGCVQAKPALWNRPAQRSNLPSLTRIARGKNSAVIWKNKKM